MYYVCRNTLERNFDFYMMADELSILFIVILAIAGGTLMTLLLSFYACIFRDLCCKQAGENLKKRSEVQKRIRNSQNEGIFNQQLYSIAMNDVTQVESMPTESEKV